MMWTRVLAGVLLACGVLPATTWALDQSEREEFRPLVQKVSVNGQLLYQAGVISGKATATGPATVTVQVTDAKKGTATQVFKLQVN